MKPSRWLNLAVACWLGGMGWAWAQSDLILDDSQIPVNVLSFDPEFWVPPIGGAATPGQFQSGITPSRAVFQDFDQESNGISLDPKLRRFAAIEGSYTWTQAFEDARSRGGRLAVITSAAEQQEMMDAIGTSGGGNLWLGATDERVEGQWEWVTGEPFIYSNWAPGEPNGGTSENHLELRRSSGLWNDVFYSYTVQQQVLVGMLFGVPIYQTVTHTVPTLRGYVLEIENNPQVVRGGSGANQLFIESMVVGMPYLAKASEVLIGGIIHPPMTDEAGNLLSERPVPLIPEEYWETQPLNVEESLDTEHENYGRFYFSAAANSVFATRAGGTRIVWVKRTPSVPPPPEPERNDPTLWLNRGGVFFRIYAQDYLVGASPVKRPKRIYWTEGEGAQGVPIYVPPNRVASIEVVYHGAFPKQVPVGQGTPVFDGGIGSSDPDANQGQAESRSTLSFSKIQNLLRAANHEGRVFIELLGASNPSTGLSEHLGFEVVDVVSRTVPNTSNVDLGDRIPVPQQAEILNVGLFPKVANIPEGDTFVYRINPTNNDEDNIYHAIRETRNANDLMIWWLVFGEQGILWPEVLHRYNLAWPTDPAKYSHYVRPLVETEEQAAETAVALPRENSPIIEYQDDEANPRAKFTSDFRFFTFLQPQYPAHRSLLSFKSGTAVAFERVFSWLQPALENEQWGGSIAESLQSWQQSVDEEGTVSHRMNWANVLTAPRLLTQSVRVGERIESPEPTSFDGYLAGFIQLDDQRNDLFNLFAYIDPFVAGFDEARAGAIIPVNRLPGRDILKVMWFRQNQFPPNRGFGPIYWPSILAEYQIQWPHEDPNWEEDNIVLASNAGSGGLNSMQARGSIYVQNDRALPGYNPNEEHALMAGGQAYALRDDLNIVEGDDYSSEPYVLLMYLDESERPNMRPFRVLREDEEHTFERILTAGTVVQPPMPLPLLPKPVPGIALQDQFMDLGLTEMAINLNQTVRNARVQTSEYPDDSSQRWQLSTSERMLFGDFSHLFLEPAEDSDNPLLHFYGYLATWPFDIEGYVSEVPPHRLPVPDPEYPGDGIPLNEVRYTLEGHHVTDLLNAVGEGDEVLLANRADREVRALTVVARDPDNNTLVLDYNTADFLELDTAREWLNRAGRMLIVPSRDAELMEDNALQDYTLTADPFPIGVARTHPSFDRYAVPLMKDRKGNIWAYRGPHSEVQEAAQFQAHWFYKTLEGFFFPGLDDQPAVGTIAPYLRPRNMDGTYQGPAFIDQTTTQVGSYPVVYRVSWPGLVPELRPGQTLAKPIFGLPAIRGNTSAEVFYEQSRADEDFDHNSVSLIDPTREKQYFLSETGLSKIPASIRTSQYRGRTYFPNLPPHLVERLFLDPNRGQQGALVFLGEFKDEPVGEDYFLLNVAQGDDLSTLLELVDTADDDADNWQDAIHGLSTVMETFRENPSVRGTYIVEESLNVEHTVSSLPVVTDSDTAIDSYALTANGPGHGFVSLIMGNGSAFTPPEEPVSIHIIRVGGPLHRGQVKPITAANPLAEMLTMMHSPDLAGATHAFDYDWRIAGPVDGRPPPVYEKQRFLLGTSNWRQLAVLQPGEGRSALPPASSPRWKAAAPGTLLVTQQRAMTSGGSFSAGTSRLNLNTSQPHGYHVGDRVRLEGFVPEGYNTNYTVQEVGGTTALSLGLEAGFGPIQTPGYITEIVSSTGPHSILAGTFSLDPDQEWDDLHLSLALAPELAVRVWLNGSLVITRGWPQTDNTLTGPAPFGFNPLQHVYRIDSSLIRTGTHQLLVELRSNAQPGVGQFFDLRVEANQWQDHPNLGGSQWLSREAIQEDLRRIILGESADVQALSDNYVIVRYRARNPDHSTWEDRTGNGQNDNWSKWTDPALAEGWIKRVLAGINPFNQRVTDLFSNQVDTTASILTQAGPRWEGDVALSLESINDFGLIEIYETVLNRGRMLSIDAGIDYGPANDALLLAAGYINDLYMMLGNEAWADAANPTIGISTSHGNYGSIATALFAFKGQVANLLEEELALLRGRDDFPMPGTRIRPVYNRLYWNYTRGIDSGEVIYAINYNIQEDNDQGVDGVIDADDARKMYPQGHGDAYGHYLTALKGYYQLLMSPSFTWVPRVEAVNVLGVPVQVDYSDERKFAAAASAVARTGKQVVDLTWRRDYEPRTSPDESPNWDSMLAPKRGNASTGVTRYWGVDHWASRTAQGALIHWVVGNAKLPEVDPDPTHEGIQKIDRTTVPELRELPVTLEALQVSVDNAEAGLNPLGLPEDTIPMDLDPRLTTTHFEQVYSRALVALRNASASFDDAKDVTRMMRAEQDSLADFQAQVANQELAYKHRLIELYGTPYPDDMGPGRTYRSDYDGPDLFHYMYVDTVRRDLLDAIHDSPNEPFEVRIDLQDFPDNWDTRSKTDFDWISRGLYPNGDRDDRTGPDGATDESPAQYLVYHLDAHGFLRKPEQWQSRRRSPGEIQRAINAIIIAHNEAHEALASHEWAKYDLDRSIELFESKVETHENVQAIKWAIFAAKEVLRWTKYVANTTIDSIELAKEMSTSGQEAAKEAVPKVTIAGMAVGGDFLSVARATITLGQAATKGAMDVVKHVTKAVLEAFENAVETANSTLELGGIATLEWEQELREGVYSLESKLGDLQGTLYGVHDKLQKLSAAYENYRAVVARGDRIQEEREIFRRRASAITQGYRTRDAAFRIFRNEKLERYKTLQDLASKYTYLAAKAYDYETGLLNTTEGKRFLNRVVASRALGVISQGMPQYAGSETGDPGLSSILAEMKADYDVLYGRLGFNNPAPQVTTASLRMEQWRILPTQEGNDAWYDVLQTGRVPDIMNDAEVRRFCLGLNLSDGAPVPGIILEFGTAIEPGYNLFGQKLAAGDHAFDGSAFATKILSVGVALEGYIGMDANDVTGGLVGLGNGQSPSGSLTQYLNPQGLAANPYVYLIPVGQDIMRSPPLGDVNQIRAWQVQDVAIPLPFNIGASGFSNNPVWTSSDSLSEPIFAIRRHPAFRPVDNAAQFAVPTYSTSTRLIGRSVWNSRWKLVIPGDRLLNDPNEGLNRFQQTVRDIKIHFKTYSYAGN